MPTLRRYLDGCEAPHVNAAPAHVAEYHGTLADGLLRAAFDALCRRYPLLCARVHATAGERYVLSVSPGDRPEFVTVDGDEATLFGAVFGPWDAENAVARLIHVRGEAGGFVGLRIDHSVVDGHSMRAIFDDLWCVYGELAGGAEIAELSVAVRPALPRSPAELLRERWFAPDPARDRRPGGNPGRVIGLRVRPHQGYLRLDRWDTSRLLTAARERGTTVHALICGAILVAQCAYGIPEPTGPVRMVCLSPVNLRNRVSPPVGVTETTTFTRIHRAELGIPVDQDPVVVGRQLKRQLDRAIVDRDLLSVADLPDALATPVDTPLDQRLAIAQVSNNGVVHAPLNPPPGVRITDFFSPVDVILGIFPIYSVFTYRGRLSIRYLFPSNLFSAEDVGGLVDAVATRLAKTGR